MVERGNLAVIPARGGSKRLPGKNTLAFRGRPMIAWTIEAALESELFDRVIVSTDSPDIARVAAECGLKVPFLRDGAADDMSPVSEATIRALEQAESHFGETYATVCQLMANCPLRSAGEIVEAYANFERTGSEFQVSCFKFGWMNPWWALRLDSGGRAERLFPEVMGKRSQDLDELYCPTGAIWLALTGALKKAGTFYGPGVRYCPIDWKSAVDIDDSADLEMAEAIAASIGLK